MTLSFNKTIQVLHVSPAVLSFLDISVFLWPTNSPDMDIITTTGLGLPGDSRAISVIKFINFGPKLSHVEECVIPAHFIAYLAEQESVQELPEVKAMGIIFCSLCKLRYQQI